MRGRNKIKYTNLCLEARVDLRNSFATINVPRLPEVVALCGCNFFRVEEMLLPIDTAGNFHDSLIL